MAVWLAELTWEEAQAYQRRAAVALLPVGATEAHGPHLSLGTDVVLSAEVAARAQEVLGERGRLSVIAPALAYAVTEFGAEFAGTVSLRAETAAALYEDVLRGLLRSGFARVCVVNSHLEPAHIAVLRAACARVAAESSRVVLADQTERRWARTLSEEYRRGDCHAGRYETALMMAASAAGVREEIRELLPDNDSAFLRAVKQGAHTFAAAGGPLAYFGAPAAATAAEGQALYGLLVAMVVQTIEEAWPSAQQVL